MWEKLLPVLLPFAGTVLGVVLTRLYDLKFKRIDDAAQIRKELREEIGHLRAAADEFSEKYQREREISTDLDIALSRAVSRVEECAEIIDRLLQAEEFLDAGDVRKARIILKLVEMDREMRKQMDLDRREKWGAA